jgi:hypothetical protein
MLATANHRVSGVEYLGRAGVVGALFEHSFLERYAVIYARELDLFIECLEESRQIELDVAHTVTIQTIADGLGHREVVTRSLKSNQALLGHPSPIHPQRSPGYSRRTVRAQKDC